MPGFYQVTSARPVVSDLLPSPVRPTDRSQGTSGPVETQSQTAPARHTERLTVEIAAFPLGEPDGALYQSLEAVMR